MPFLLAAQRARALRPAGRTIVLTGDTGPSDRLAAFARGADLLVAEVIDLAGTRAALADLPGLTVEQLDRLMMNLRADHLTSEDAGRLAAAAGARCLVLTHVAPGRDGETDFAPYVEGARRYFSGPLFLASDRGRY